MKQGLQANCKLVPRLCWSNEAKHQLPSLTILLRLVLQFQNFSCRQCLLCKSRENLQVEVDFPLPLPQGPLYPESTGAGERVQHLFLEGCAREQPLKCHTFSHHHHHRHKHMQHRNKIWDFIFKKFNVWLINMKKIWLKANNIFLAAQGNWHMKQPLVLSFIIPLNACAPHSCINTVESWNIQWYACTYIFSQETNRAITINATIKEIISELARLPKLQESHAAWRFQPP